MSLSFYDKGDTQAWSCRADPRFSFLCHVPQGALEAGSKRPLIVAVHGSRRRNQDAAAPFIALAQRHNAIVLAPLFPAGIVDERDESSYKLLHHGGLRYDAILLGMVEQVAAKWPVDPDRFLLFGFSGGAHFAHRFLYVRPERLMGVSIGAPGIVTLPRDDHPWWVGIGDMKRRFGHALDAAAVARVPVHAAVGGDDTDTWEITVKPGSLWSMPGDTLAGPDRPTRLANLVDGLRGLGATVEHEIVPGVRHQHDPVAARAAAYFDRLLSARQGEAA